MTPRDDLPLSGRRFYFVGIGGAGLSAYANFSCAWGAEVRGWEARDTIFLEALNGIDVDLGGEPSPPAGFEVVVSAAHASRIQGRARAEFLAELVALRRSIVVGGAHGKTTTTAMIAYVLRELGEDPSWIIGGVVPQLGGNAGTGAGWLVVEGDGPISIAPPPKHCCGDQHRARSPCGVRFRGRAGVVLRGLAAGGATRCSRVGARCCRPPVGRARRHNRRNAATALTVLDLAGVPRSDAERTILGFAGVGRRFELVGERGGVRVLDDYAHNPTEIAATLRTARDLTEGRLIAVYQPHVYARTRQLSQEPVPALGLADATVVTDVVDGRDPPIAGVSGKLVLDNVANGVRRGWAPTPDDARALALEWARPGDVIITLGVGEPWRIARAIVQGLPD
jgi:UDP-N-acetylmuramate--alanine ligase